jgi:anti-anti-sigma factor
VAAHNRVEIKIHSAAACIVTLRGEHDVSSREAVSLALAAARGYPSVLVDLAGCTFIDSSIITSLLLASKRTHQAGGTLELVVPSEANAVRRTLEIANIQMIMPFHETPEAGLASLAAAVLRAPRRMRAAATLAETVEHVPPKTRAGVTILRARIADEPAVQPVAAELDAAEIDPPGDEGQLAA